MWHAESFVAAGECYLLSPGGVVFLVALSREICTDHVCDGMFRLCSKKCCKTLVFLKEVCIKQTAGFLDANRTCKTAKLLLSACPERAVGRITFSNRPIICTDLENVRLSSPIYKVTCT